MSGQASALQLSARQCEMLAFMGLPMQGWPVQIAPLPMRASAPNAPSAPSVAPAAGVLLDTMNPAVRSMPLGLIRQKMEGFGELNPATVVAASVGATQKSVDADGTSAPLLWNLEGQLQTQLEAQSGLLLCEAEVDGAQFPLSADSWALLRNILQALQWPETQHVALSAVSAPAPGAAALDWQLQIQRWQPAWVLLLGRQACKLVLPAQAAAATGLGAMRGQAWDWDGRPVRVSYPLAYLLRNPLAKIKAWQDWLALKWVLESS